jgi:hypothetical protein
MEASSVILRCTYDIIIVYVRYACFLENLGSPSILPRISLDISSAEKLKDGVQEFPRNEEEALDLTSSRGARILLERGCLAWGSLNYLRYRDGAGLVKNEVAIMDDELATLCSEHLDGLLAVMRGWAIQKEEEEEAAASPRKMSVADNYVLLIGVSDAEMVEFREGPSSPESIPQQVVGGPQKRPLRRNVRRRRYRRVKRLSVYI